EPTRPVAGASSGRAGHAGASAGGDRGHAGAHQALAGKRTHSLHPPHSALYTLLRRRSPSVSVVLPCSRSFRSPTFRRLTPPACGLWSASTSIFAEARFLRCWARTAPARRP